MVGAQRVSEHVAVSNGRGPPYELDLLELEMNASNRLLWHSIDAATPRGRHRSGLGGTILVLTFTLSVCGLLLWADRFFV